MTATLHSIQDARNPIQKLSRKELEYLARYEKRDDIVEGMPAELMKRKFLDRPPAMMPIPVRSQLGSDKRLIVPPYETWVRVAFARPGARRVEPEEIPETDAVSDLEKQWLAQKAAETDFAALPFWKLKQECKARGIAFTRTDNKAALVAKLNGQDPA